MTDNFVKTDGGGCNCNNYGYVTPPCFKPKCDGCKYKDYCGNATNAPTNGYYVRTVIT